MYSLFLITGDGLGAFSLLIYPGLMSRRHEAKARVVTGVITLLSQRDDAVPLKKARSNIPYSSHPIKSLFPGHLSKGLSRPYGHAFRGHW